MSEALSSTTDCSRLRAWLALIGISMRRQARSRQMLWVALILLGSAVAMVYNQTIQAGWTIANTRYVFTSNKPRLPFDFPKIKTAGVREADRVVTTHGDIRDILTGTSASFAVDPVEKAVFSAGAGGYQAAIEGSAVVRFTRMLLFVLVLNFLLPLWCLAFATEALGSDLESRSLVWLLTRPLPRWSVYIAKYIALLPWAFAFTIGGFGLMCLVAGHPGRVAFFAYWPAIAMGTFAFTSVFHLFSAATRRPTVVGLVYCFFLETLLGDMPGLMKRVSVSFYVRCLVFDTAEQYGIQPDKPSVYLPVDGSTAWMVLAGITITGLIVGAWVFSRAEYRDDAT